MIEATTRPRRAGGAVPQLAALVAALAVIVGLSARRLGTPLPPFLMRWQPEINPLVLFSVAAITGAALAAPIILTRIRHPAGFAAGVYLLSIALGLSLNLARAGASGWSSAFHSGSHEAANEYLPALTALAHGSAQYVRHFAQLLAYLPVHVRGNPPGPLVALKLLGVHTAPSLTALIVCVGALSAPLAYDLGRVLGGEQQGRCAALLTAFAPSILLFGVSSVDYVFATLGLCAACLLVRPGSWARIAGAACVALCSFLSWLLLAIPAWAAIVILRREGRGPALVWACVSLLAVLGFDVTLVLAVGYDPVAVLRATSAAYHHGISATRPYLYWALGSPVAWALMLGPATVWLALRSLADGDPTAAAIATVVLTASLLGFTKAETERIWLPFVPLACVAAAASQPRRGLRLLLWSLVIQGLAIELLFDTVW